MKIHTRMKLNENEQTGDRFRISAIREQAIGLWGGAPTEALEERMLVAAASEANSLAWLSGAPHRNLGGLLESKIREAKDYVRQQRRIKSQSQQIVSTAF